jgi:hypothetical protein
MVVLFNEVLRKGPRSLAAVGPFHKSSVQHRVGDLAFNPQRGRCQMLLSASTKLCGRKRDDKRDIRRAATAARGTLNLAGSLRGKLSVLGQHPASVFVGHNTEKAAEHLDTLVRAVAVLNDVITLQQAAAVAASQPIVQPQQAEVRPQ